MLTILKNTDKVQLLNHWLRLKASAILSKFIVAGAAVMLSACVSAPISDERLAESDASLIEHNNEQIKLAKHDDLNEDLNLPKQELTADTLEQLLTFNFASLTGQLPLATRSALSSAQATQDVRLARLATLFSLQTADYNKASTASAIWVALKPDSDDANNMHIIALVGAAVGAAKIEQAKQAIGAQMQGQPIDEYIKQLAALLVRQKNAEAGFDTVVVMVCKEHFLQCILKVLPRNMCCLFWISSVKTKIILKSR